MAKNHSPHLLDSTSQIIPERSHLHSLPFPFLQAHPWIGKHWTLQPFHFDTLGALCVVGHQTACAELTVPFARRKSMRFSGLLAWLMWRGIYLSKLPGLERKVRVFVDWTIELFFPRDIVQTIDLS
jgi:NADH dehydrogenase FAD-containing subunit